MSRFKPAKLLIKPYIVDEYGAVNSTNEIFLEESVGSQESLNAEQKITGLSQQTESKKFVHSNRTEKVNAIPESEPAGILDLTQLPNGHPFRSVRPPLQKKKRIYNTAEYKSNPQSRKPIDEPLIKCIHCDTLIKLSNLVQHIERNHPPVSTSDRTRCPICDKKMKHVNLGKHINTVHILKSFWASMCSTEQRKIQNQRTRWQNHSTVNSFDDKYSDQEFEESFVERRDGGKYLGFMKREHGKFGSLSLYDSHDDESGAE